MEVGYRFLSEYEAALEDFRPSFKANYIPFESINLPGFKKPGRFMPGKTK
jgi:hypothetical protein